MKLSNLFVKTSKEDPSGETSANAKLLTRAGFIYKEMAGVYTYLPLWLRVLEKIKMIIRKHMDCVASEVAMTILWPEANWQATGRIDTVDVLMKTHGANELSQKKCTNEYVINYSHEEMVTPIIKAFVSSYKDLPCAVYQIGTKFRNEARAKSGLLRGREFTMKDAYSFHASEKDFLDYYETIKGVYKDIYEELWIGGETVIAMASGGDFTEKYSHEFQTLCDAGEDTLFIDDSINLVYNKEIAPSKAIDPDYSNMDMLVMEDVYGENVVSVEKLVEFLQIPIERTVKTLIYEDEAKNYYAVAVRGDYDVNELKLKKALSAKSVALVAEDIIQKLTWAERGYAGIVNLPDTITLVCDDSIENLKNFESGTNKTHYHTININRDRDLPRPPKFYDIKEVRPWDKNPETNTVYRVEKAAEVGNIFPLETRFPDAFHFQYMDESNKLQPIIMWCYGIGVSRVMGVIVERYHDEKGIIRPENIAPFQYVIIGIGDQWLQRSKKLYEDLRKVWVDVCFDDRNLGPGFKLKDADLIGYPYQIIIGNKTLEEGDYCEVCTRKTGKKEKKLISLLIQDVTNS